MATQEAVRKILVAYDGSEPALRALELAAKIAKACNAKLYIMHVAPVPEDYADCYECPEVMAKVLEKGKQLLERARQILSSLGVDAETVLDKGDPGKRIVEKAEELDVDVVVVGSTGRSGVKKLILGSVSEKVARSSSRPVLIVK